MVSGPFAQVIKPDFRVRVLFVTNNNISSPTSPEQRAASLVGGASW